MKRLLEEQPLEAQAQAALDVRLGKREAASRAVGQGAFSQVDGVFFAYLSAPLDGEFFPALLPLAQVIIVFSPHPEAGRWFVKVRLGQAAPEGLSLHQLHINSFDPGYGGRWNAGSNKRGGQGTLLKPQAYAANIAASLQPMTVEADVSAAK